MPAWEERSSRSPGRHAGSLAHPAPGRWLLLVARSRIVFNSVYLLPYSFKYCSLGGFVAIALPYQTLQVCSPPRGFMASRLPRDSRCFLELCRRSRPIACLLRPFPPRRFESVPPPPPFSPLVHALPSSATFDLPQYTPILDISMIWIRSIAGTGPGSGQSRVEILDPTNVECKFWTPSSILDCVDSDNRNPDS